MPGVGGAGSIVVSCLCTAIPDRLYGITVFDGNDSTVPTLLCAAVCRVCNDLELVLLQPSGKGIQSSGSSGGGNTDVDPCFSVRVFRWVIFKLVRIHVIGTIVLC